LNLALASHSNSQCLVRPEISITLEGRGREREGGRGRGREGGRERERDVFVATCVKAKCKCVYLFAVSAGEQHWTVREVMLLHSRIKIVPLFTTKHTRPANTQLH
jgi:hypothetical protein